MIVKLLKGGKPQSKDITKESQRYVSLVLNLTEEYKTE